MSLENILFSKYIFLKTYSMTTPYGISTSKGSQTFQGFVNAAVGGPLNSNQYPFVMQ